MDQHCHVNGQQDKDGNTALHLAVRFGGLPILQQLLHAFTATAAADLIQVRPTVCMLCSVTVVVGGCGLCGDMLATQMLHSYRN